MKTPISSLMRRDVCRVGLDDTVAQVERTLLERRVTWVPVMQANGTAMGVISAADLLRFHAGRQDPDTTRAWQLCTYKPAGVAPDTPADDAARLMLERAIHHLLVVDGNGLCGVVSSMDLLAAFMAPARRRGRASRPAPAGGDAAQGDGSPAPEEDAPEPPGVESCAPAAPDRDDLQQALAPDTDVERVVPEPADAQWIDAELGPAGRR